MENSEACWKDLEAIPTLDTSSRDPTWPASCQISHSLRFNEVYSVRQSSQSAP